MAERSGFFNANLQDGTYDRQYDASDFTDYFSLFIGDGVFVNPANQLQVTAKSGLKVTVKAGAAFIEGCWYILTEDMDVDIPANIAQYAVNTNVCVTLSRANREIKLRVRPAVSSMLPVNNGNEHDLVLASVAVGVGVSQIIDANITDRRPNKTYCGYVTGLVDQIDTSDLFQQFTSEFNTWFDDIVAKLGDEPATSLQTQVDNLDERLDAVETKSESNRTGLQQTNTNIGSLSSLTTGVKTSIVNAINWLKTQVDGKVNTSAIVNNLTTTASGRVLDARQGKTLNDRIGTLSSLTTSTKTNIVAAINWLKSQFDGINNRLTGTVTAALNSGVGGYAYAIRSGGFVIVTVDVIITVPTGSDYQWFTIGQFSISSLKVSRLRESYGVALITGGGPPYADYRGALRTLGGTSLQLQVSTDKAITDRHLTGVLVVPIIS